MNGLKWFSGVLFSSTLAAMSDAARGAVEEWWDDFLTLWGLFNPEFRARWQGEQREQLDADAVWSGGGGNFECAGTGGND